MTLKPSFNRFTLAGLAFLLVAVLVELHPWSWGWVKHAASFLSRHPVSAAFASLSIAFLFYSVRPESKKRDKERSALAWPWTLSNKGIFVISGVAAGIGIAAMAMMLVIAQNSPPTDRSKLLIEAIKYGLGFFAAAGAVAALLLSVRRQLTTEHNHALEMRKQQHVEHEAIERSITDTYSKAVEQLGSDDASVRLGSLYALERVAQNNASQRQTVVDVMCAYLRMPFSYPAEPASDQVPAGQKPSPSNGREPRQELHVRLAAQSVLLRHLCHDRVPFDVEPKPGDLFWEDIRIDLSGAVLVDWKAAYMASSVATFQNCIFVGTTTFFRAQLTGHSDFSGSKFERSVNFRRTRFTDYANFANAVFSDVALFDNSTFSGKSKFEKSTFASAAKFEKVVFAKSVHFSHSTFKAKADFSSAFVMREAFFDSVTFEKGSKFANVRVKPYKVTHSVWPAGWRLSTTSVEGLRLLERDGTANG